MKHFSTRIIILALFVTILSTIFIGCGKKEEPPHVCQFNYGECVCGRIDEEYYSAGMEFLLDQEKLEYTVTGYEGTDIKLMIPATYQGLPVTKIADRAFSYDMSYGKVHIGKNVHTIGEKAFYGAQRMVEITIPEQVKNIGLNAFSECTKVSNIYFNAIECNSPYQDKSFVYELDGIWDGVGSQSLSKDCVLTIGNKVKVIPMGMFYSPSDAKKSFINEIIFEDNSQCESIEFVAFLNLRRLERIDFGENASLKFVGETAFGNAFKIEEYIFPDTIETVEKYAFGGNKILTRVYLPAGDWQAVRIYYGQEIDRFDVTLGTPEEIKALISEYGNYNFTRVG
ncbi:MAG: leucine-rich repeat protein [Clostridia bacterium]|nr:leucine-rich repeat protein [Clostridia bacterium]